MTERSLTVAINGVTGRMGTNQHFIRSILAIMKQGGVKCSDGSRIQVRPILLGRSESKLQHLAHAVASSVIGKNVEYSTDVDAMISDPSVDVVFDASGTLQRAGVIAKAVEKKKAIYCEKPIATQAGDAQRLADMVDAAGVANGVVQDKLWLPGIRKLRMLRDQGFFGEIKSVRAEFGYWVFTGHHSDQPAQRPSWNYRREDGGGVMIDMFCHWQYLIQNLFGEIERVLAHATIDIPERIDESGKPYHCTADDSAYAIFVLKNGVTCQFNSSWVTRVRRDDLLTVQVDGTLGSAVAGLRECWVQSLASTPKPVWNPDIAQPIQFYEGWQQIPNATEYDNAFKIQWELFLRHVVGDGDFPWSIRSGAAGVELAEAGETSVREQRWVNVSNYLAAANASGGK